MIVLTNIKCYSIDTITIIKKCYSIIIIIIIIIIISIIIFIIMIQVEEMIHNIKSAFYTMVKSANWIDEGTKNATLEKVKDVNTSIGFPDWILSRFELGQYYEDVSGGYCCVNTWNDKYYVKMFVIELLICFRWR